MGDTLPPPDFVATAPPRQFRPPTYGEVVECEGGRLYQLGGQIGQGAFGAVYECTDEWGNELVAKVLLPREKTYEEIRARWLHEATNLLTLRHPNITYVYDAFEYRDTFYVVIERCVANLAQWPWLRGEAWLPYVARDVLQGVGFIHSRGFVHKDIHPGNVLVRQVGEPSKSTGEPPLYGFKIGDLGIANLQSDVTFTMAEWMLPPEYLSPQHYGPIGPHTDIYHCGLLLLGLLLPQAPTFSHDDIFNGVPAQLARQAPSIYGLAIAAALTPHTAQRTQTAPDFWRALRRAALG